MDQPLYVYGKGSLGELAVDFLNHVGEPPDLIFDRESIPVSIDEDAIVAVAVITSPYDPIERMLEDLGFIDVVPFYDLARGFVGRHPLADNGWLVEKLSPDEATRTADVYRRWSDDVSRMHHHQFIAWRTAREELTFDNAPVTNEDRYFIPEVVAALHDHEVFLDGGYYDGRSWRRFADIVGWKYDRIFAFEPDLRNSPAVAEGLSPSIRPFALSDEDGFAPFYGGYGFSSRLGAPDGYPLVRTVRIDSLDMAPTFVKLHLEGGELAALRGARATLQKHRPIIAATVYHNSDGIYRTAEWLQTELEDYRFLFRNHCWQGAGAVVYAIPNERDK